MILRLAGVCRNVEDVIILDTFATTQQTTRRHIMNFANLIPKFVSARDGL
jgi:hypothetical protein